MELWTGSSTPRFEQVSGYLLSQNYTEGSQIKKGALLFQIDPRPFEAVLAQATSKLAQDQAQLSQLLAVVQLYRALGGGFSRSTETTPSREIAGH